MDVEMAIAAHVYINVDSQDAMRTTKPKTTTLLTADGMVCKTMTQT